MLTGWVSLSNRQYSALSKNVCYIFEKFTKGVADVERQKKANSFQNSEAPDSELQLKDSNFTSNFLWWTWWWKLNYLIEIFYLLIFSTQEDA